MCEMQVCSLLQVLGIESLTSLVGSVDAQSLKTEIQPGKLGKSSSKIWNLKKGRGKVGDTEKVVKR